ncbi:MAG: GspH/FimT family protein [Gemmatimonadota bacterium]
MTTSASARRSGLTLVELVLVMTIIGLTTLVMMRQLQLLLDRMATRDAVRAAAGAVNRARDEALAQHTRVSVRIDTATADLDVRAHGASLGHTGLAQTHAVKVSTTRDSITFDTRGLGYGAANLTLVARRGAAADTLTVSRLGRVKY